MLSAHWRPQTGLQKPIYEPPSIWKNGKWKRRASALTPSAEMCNRGGLGSLLGEI